MRFIGMRIGRPFRLSFSARVTDAVAQPAWVVDGNYSKTRDLVWASVDAVVWLDYPLPVILAQLVRRTFRRMWTGELLWGNNREEWCLLFSRDSIFLWALQTYHRRRRIYTQLLRDPAQAHLAVVRLRNPRERARWLEEIASEI